MSKKQCSDSTRSVSDGDLTSSDNCNIRNGEVSDSALKNTDKQVFFTLPRWMSGRKRSRSKIKYVKVDVPFTNDNNDENIVKPKISNGKKGSERPGNFVSKLFRRSSFFSNSGSSKNHVRKHYPKVPVLQTISSSNTDIRTNNVVFYSFDFHEYFRDKIPAVCGIKNHGNTCFMNAVIQCLCNTDTFAEYFVMSHYKMDFLRRNKVHSKKYGTRGEVTEQLAVLLKSLWSCQYYANISNKFKNLVAKYGSQYEGSEQHDAQEFLLWLLDKVHEDLNTAPKQKYKKPKGSYGRTDEEIAAEMLANHLRCNSSFVHDLFQGQIRSSLCCLGCGRFSNTFDPYLCISLPIPQYQTTQIFLNLVYLNVELKMIKVGVSIDSQATVSDLFGKLSCNFGLPPKNILLTEIIDGEFLRNFKESDPVSSFKDSEGIFAIETPTSQPTSSQTVEQEKILLIIVCCIRIDDTECELFWKPFALEIVREISYKNLQLQILDAISPVLSGSVDLETESPFCLLVVDGDPTYEVLCSSVDLPLYMPVIDQALMLHDEKGIKHLKLVLEWRREAEYLLRKDLSFCENHPSVAEVTAAQKASNDVSLYECFDAYFNEERLGVDDAWMCPCCRHRLPSVKQLSLWTVPDILIVHLKRFRQSSNQRTKMTTFVKFPSSGLDLQQYIATRCHPVQQPSQNSLAFWSPWKRSRSNPYSKSDEHVYDLFAVCNHHGTMQGGHYTACCRNPINGHWYLFDDTNVQEVQVSDVISSDAYILFYQRSSLSALSCASSSSSGYSSASSNYSVGLDHWAFRMPLPYRDVPITSKSQDNLYDVGNTASLDRRIASRPFHRTSRSYSTMPHYNDEKAICSTIPRSVYEAPSYVDSYSYKDEIPPPPPPSTKHYWTVTSV